MEAHSENALQVYVDHPSTHLDELLESDPRLRSLHTRKGYRESIQAFDKWRQGRPLTKSLLLLYMSDLQREGKAAATINLRLSAIRWYARKLADMAADYSDDEKLTDDFARRAARILTVQIMKLDRSLKGRFISSGELEALLDACRKDKSLAGRRDAAIIALLWASGMRRGELNQIEMSDLTKSDDGFVITIRHGKGDKSRIAYCHDGAAHYLEDWLEVRGAGEGLVFYALDHKRKYRDASISCNGLHYMLQRRAREAGISEPTSLHDFRRTNISLLWDAGVDGSTIQRLAGHASQNTTAAYDRRPQEAQMQASRVIHVPYRR